MATFRYVGTEGRTFPDLGLVVDVADVLEAEANPDTRFFTDAPGAVPTTHDHDDAGEQPAVSEEA